MLTSGEWSEARLWYRFGDPALLDAALTHRSAGKQNYERLEFLGYAVLNFAVARLVFGAFPDADEGDLSRYRSALVSRSLAAAAASGTEDHPGAAGGHAARGGSPGIRPPADPVPGARHRPRNRRTRGPALWGDLATVLRASMSAPGLLAPVEIGGRMLVDGGLVDNLPVSLARSMGVDVLIAVDVSFPLARRDGLASPLDITNQMIAIMVRRGTADSIRRLGKRDVLVSPELGRMTAIDFARMPQVVSAGLFPRRSVGSGVRSASG